MSMQSPSFWYMYLGWTLYNILEEIANRKNYENLTLISSIFIFTLWIIWSRTQTCYFKDSVVLFTGVIIFTESEVSQIVRAPEDHGKLATIFKSEKRNEMVKEGYRILGNSGDQWSDLLGSSTANRSFKLPNPMYYIPWLGVISNPLHVTVISNPLYVTVHFKSFMSNCINWGIKLSIYLINTDWFLQPRLRSWYIFLKTYFYVHAVQVLCFDGW